jgi:hypothetical protein
MQFVQPALFPISDLQTDGYAQPDPAVEETDADTQPDAVEDAA